MIFQIWSPVRLEANAPIWPPGMPAVIVAKSCAFEPPR